MTWIIRPQKKKSVRLWTWKMICTLCKYIFSSRSPLRNFVLKYHGAREFHLWKSIVSSRSHPRNFVWISGRTCFEILKIDLVIKIAHVNFPPNARSAEPLWKCWKMFLPCERILLIWKWTFSLREKPLGRTQSDTHETHKNTNSSQMKQCEYWCNVFNKFLWLRLLADRASWTPVTLRLLADKAPQILGARYAMYMKKYWCDESLFNYLVCNLKNIDAMSRFKKYWCNESLN